MIEPFPGQVQGLRSQNRRAILAAIRRLGRTARVDIARETGMSAATVTSITADLVARGLVEEVVDEEARTAGVTRGRPRVLLRIRPDAYLVGGAKISEDHITVTLMDFEGNESHHHVVELRLLDKSPEEVAAHLRRATEAALKLTGRALGDLACLGVGLPGFVEAARGRVWWSPCFRMRDVPFGALLAAAFPFPVFIDNDANLAALAEQWFGYGQGVADFLVVTIEQGVGMGIVLDHRLFRGTRGIGAEFGHVKVERDGALCRCGQRGCLEAYVADYALLREAPMALDPGGPPLAPRAALDALFAAAKAGDPTALSIFDRAGRMFSLGLANLVNIFDPALVIFSGEQMRFDFLYGARVLEQMRGNTLATGRPGPRVRVHKWGDRLWAMGAAALAIDGLTERVLREPPPGEAAEGQGSSPASR
ncbi:ROK family transcriptional regulator [Amaricoccus solimangrovi]|uniref:ROK family transcriptional regulator n=1 Tax=Amaricoccus solimangrovi TaxID=2589815 RepID=UPI001F489706|nr:ROK family transcriptional regulator [Amaricoccus solimangrovi]